jgi:SM-20-related protein
MQRPSVQNDVHEIAAARSKDSAAVHDRFLDEKETRALAACAALRSARGEFLGARIGANVEPHRAPHIRGDRICWLSEPLYPAERRVVAALEQLRLACNREAVLGLFDLELHYARYAPGAGYARHVDRPRRDRCTGMPADAAVGARIVTIVLYLNSHWDGRTGGELRLFDATFGHRDIAPLGGRLVCFLTEGREHEVLPARRTRLSLTGWFRSRGVGAPF